MDCPYCGITLRDFQTKDQYMPRMDILRPYQPIETKWVKKEGQKFPLESIVLKRVTNWYTSQEGAHCEVKIEEFEKETLSTTGAWEAEVDDS
jgi:hypothetical protein